MKRGRLMLMVVLGIVVVAAIWRIQDPPGGTDSPDPAGTGAGQVEPDPATSGTGADPDAPAEPLPADAVAAPALPGPPAPAPLPAANPPSPQRQSPAAPPLPAGQRPAPVVPEPALAAVEALALNIREYRNRFGGNPVGTNAEIVREMDGGNAKGAAYLPADLKRLNGEGELIDEWGTPYFFHQESAGEMEIRSAGADRVMWTSDDLVAR